MMISRTSLVQLALGAACLVLGCSAVYPDVQGFEIYSGEHLDHTIMPPQGGVSFVHAVLVIYQTECYDHIWTYAALPGKLPMTKDVHLLWHDYEMSNTRTWYDYNGDDLRKRFSATTCLDVVFIPRGSGYGSGGGDRWAPGGQLSFSDWVWQQLVVSVELVNSLDTTVQVTSVQTGQTSGPAAYPAFTIAARGSATVSLYESSLVRVTVKQLNPVTRQIDDRLVGVWIINDTTVIQIAQQESPPRRFDDVFDEVQAVTRQEDFDALETAWAMMQGHLLNLKQPLVVPQFTPTGYKKVRMPESWFKVISDFYHENTGERKNESWTFGNSAINQNEVQCSMVWLSEEVKDTVAEGLRLMMEDWCGMELETTAFYGVREYFGGNILRNHVDRLDTHVISAIIQVDKDLGGEDDWLLEVIEYGGNRSHVKLEPGDMLMYESARLIHGRPEVFRGRLYANVFLHFRPKNDWEGLYLHDKDGFKLHYPDGQTEVMMPLNSSLTMKHGYQRQLVQVPKLVVPRDEL